MSAKSVTISRKELQNISIILTRSIFKDVENITIEESGSIAGLGSILTLSFDGFIIEYDKYITIKNDIKKYIIDLCQILILIIFL